MCGKRNLLKAIQEREQRLAQSPWMPASGGTETPFHTRGGRLLQYLYQPATGEHAYIDCETDIFLTDDEANRELSI
jgi:hypothetical protein